MNRSAKDGAWSSPHYGDEGAWVPLRRTKVCAGDTVGKNVSDSGRPGIVRVQGMAEIVRHSQTKGRATGNAKPSLKPANGRCGYKRKRNSGRCGARSRIELTDKPFWQAASPNPRAMCVLPVPLLPTAITLSRRVTYSQRASSSTNVLLS